MPKNELRLRNMRPMQAKHIARVIENESIFRGNSYTYVVSHSQFQLREFALFPNMLIQLPLRPQDSPSSRKSPRVRPIDEEMLQHSEFLVLSTVLLDKKNINYKESVASGLVLSSDAGSTYLFFEQATMQLAVWNHMHYFSG